jgi:hypothetical protein
VREEEEELMSSSLTPQERQTLYHPLTYGVKKVNEEVYCVRSEYTGLEFHVKKEGGIWRVHSPSGAFYDVNEKMECPCGDYPRAIKQERFCKHQAVVIAVIEFLRRTPRPVEDTRQELKEIFR